MEGTQRDDHAARGLTARDSRTLRARWVFPVSGPPIPNGVVRIEDGRIVAVAAGCPGSDIEDLGNVAILPGLVNAHTHLDLSDVEQPLGEPGIAFCDWIRRVIAFRRSQHDASSETAWQRGLAESFRLGTTTLGDIWLWSAAIYRRSGSSPMDGRATSLTSISSESGDESPHSKDAPHPAVTAFLELIAPTPERIPAALDIAQDVLGRQLHCRPEASTHRGGSTTATPTTFGTTATPTTFGVTAVPAVRIGLSPHAPYSVHPDLLAAVVALSAQHGLPLAMHLAESREEMDLLQTGGGPFRGLLEELGAWCPTLIPAASRPLHYLRTLSGAHRVLVIHGNYLDDEEIAFLAAHRRTMSVVYCPRTHAFFSHAPYPLEKMLAAGVNVALGTDSRASSPDLSVLGEMRAVARRHPTVSGDAILRMATRAGATALDCDSEVGTLESGRSADLAIIALPDRAAANPHDLLPDSDLPVVAAWRQGVECIRA